MIEVRVLVGAPSSGKSFYCQELMSKEPNRWKRLNNDSLRLSVDLGVYSPENERLIKSLREHMLREFLKAGCNVLIDNVNAGKRNWEDVVKVCKQMNKDIAIIEVPFYLPLPELIERDAKREGIACVGEKVVKKFFNDLGGDSFKNYVPRVETLTKNLDCKEGVFLSAKQDNSKPKAIICDLDGTLSLFVGKRSPYDAAKCFDDDLNVPVAETVRLYAKDGYKIIFCSGREDKHKGETIRFIEKYLPGLEYELLMRRSEDMRKDSIIKEEIYRAHIEGKYYVHLCLDDRDQVVSLWREGLGLTCFQVANGNF